MNLCDPRDGGFSWGTGWILLFTLEKQNSSGAFPCLIFFSLYVSLNCGLLGRVLAGFPSCSACFQRRPTEVQSPKPLSTQGRKWEEGEVAGRPKPRGGWTRRVTERSCHRELCLHVCVLSKFLLASPVGEVCHCDTGLVSISWN